jgi:hypothetical protein
LFAISDALAYTDSLRNRDEWRSLPRMVAPAIFRPGSRCFKRPPWTIAILHALKRGLLVAVGSDGDDLRRAPPQAPPAENTAEKQRVRQQMLARNWHDEAAPFMSVTWRTSQESSYDTHARVAQPVRVQRAFAPSPGTQLRFEFDVEMMRLGERVIIIEV